jgi:hypothetical protein
LTFHNLCTDTQPPTGTQKLLGLGLKFGTHSPTYPPNTNQSIHKLAYSIQTKNYLLTKKTNTNTEYIPQLYVKLRGWNPPPAPIHLENKLTEFEKKLKEAIKNQQKRHYKKSNLTPDQLKTLHAL